MPLLIGSTTMCLNLEISKEVMKQETKSKSPDFNRQHSILVFDTKVSTRKILLL